MIGIAKACNGKGKADEHCLQMKQVRNRQQPLLNYILFKI